jgi:hypothetical protein
MLVKNIFILIAIFLSFGCKNKSEETKNEKQNINLIKDDDAYLKRLAKKINEINTFIENKNGYNNKIAFLLDMKIASGKNRFFVVDLQNKKILKKGLVAHGYGSSILNSDSLQFSNVPNSLATSIGKYRIGKSYFGDFGKSYKLSGLDKTNSNAYDRNIVLHSYKDVPEQEVDGDICFSKGCPMVSFGFFKEIAGLIDRSKNSILIYVYY